jgi:hypothetical protein
VFPEDITGAAFKGPVDDEPDDPLLLPPQAVKNKIVKPNK